MADIGEWDEHESSYHRLLIKLKTTVEGLLASHSAQGVWSTYGGLRRVCEDTESILCHGIKLKQVRLNSDGSFWAFIQGLKWLSPSLAPVIEKVARHSQVRGGGAGGGQSEAGRAWLRDSVQDHSFVKQLDILLACQEHVQNFYHEDAFLRQEKYVNAMKICFAAIEHNKPALLSEINPSLLKRLSRSEIQERRATFPPNFSPEEKSATLPAAFSLPTRGANRFAMGSKHSRNLEVNYPNLNNSTISLIVDPSIGFRNSPQKSPSQPQFITQDSSSTVCSESVGNPQDWSEESVYTSATASSYETPTLLEEELGKSERTHSASSGSNGIEFHSASASAGLPGTGMSSPLMYDDISENVTAIRDDDEGNYKTIPHIQSADLGPRLLSPNSEDDFGLSSLNNSADDADVQDNNMDTCKPDRVDSAVSEVNKIVGCVHSPTATCDNCANRALPAVGSGVAGDMSSKAENNMTAKSRTAHSLDQVVKGDNKSEMSSSSIRTPLSSSTDALNRLSNPSGSSQHHSQTSLDFNGDVISPRVKAGLPRVLSDTCIADNDPLSPSSTRQRSPFHSTSSNQDSDLVDDVDSPKELLSTSNRSSGALYIPPSFQRAFSVARSPPGSKSSVPPRVNSPAFKPGHKRSVSDTKAIQMGKSSQYHSVRPSVPSTSSVASSGGGGSVVGAVVKDITQGPGARSSKTIAGHGHSASESGPMTMGYYGALTRPTEGQSLINYLNSQDFNTCANMEKENAHFHISEILIGAFESMSWNRMMKKSVSERSSSSSDEEIQELRQRIRIRKREKMLEKNRPFPSVSDMQTDASGQGLSPPDFSLSESSASDGESEDQQEIDLTKIELSRSNQQIQRNSSQENLTPGSAEQVAISLLKKFSEKHLPKASELKWLVSEVDAPQQLLPLPSSIPISPDDGDKMDSMRSTQTRLRGNLEWAPPRPQIIFSIHPTEKRAAVLARQNFRCAGCGTRVDPAFIKRYRYCEYLGKYFCQCCHSGDTSTIPGRVIERWDFSQYPVSNFSYTLLEKMWPEPLFHIDSINPALYRRVRGLDAIKMGRQQLHHLHSLFEVCRRDKRLVAELQKLPDHWITNDNVFSMEDFFQVKNNTMLPTINAFVVAAFSHVSKCQLCQGLGFICGLCENKRVIFPFQLSTVARCPMCHCCYHKKCFVPEKCPKCIRIASRRKQLAEADPSKSPSSDSVDSQEGVAKGKDDS